MNLSTAYRYLGCFKDGYPEIVAEKTDDLALTVFQCDEACTIYGYKYFALQNGQECSCGNNEDYDKYGPSTECDIPCYGNSSEICGGLGVSSIYEVEVPRIRMCSLTISLFEFKH